MNTNNLETKAVDLVARIAPWCAPIPTAYLVGRATMLHLGWPVGVAFVAAVIIETLGLASTSTALQLYEYNQSKRKADAGAPFALAAALVLVYFIVATGLTVALDIFPGWAVYSPAIFPTLSLTGITVLALRSDHARRLLAIEVEKAERKAERQIKRQVSHPGALQNTSSNVSNITEIDAISDRLQAGKKAKVDSRLDTLLDTLLDNPEMSISEAARVLNCSRQTVYSYVDTLQTAGRLHKNGNGWEKVTQ